MALLAAACERAGLVPRPAGRTLLRARRALAAGAGGEAAAEALRLLAADWVLAAVAAGRRPSELAVVVRGAAERLSDDPDGFRFAACARALAAPQLRRMTPRLAADTLLRTVHAFAGLDGVSLWVREPDGSLQRVASTGHGRRTRAAAAAVLAGACESRAAPVVRFGKVAGAVVACGRDAQPLLEETAAALAFFLERDLLLERNAMRERSLADALEQRLLRYGFDLHDGPLQSLAALGADLSLARRQLLPRVCPDDAARAAGRFDDLESRLRALDGELRDMLRAVTATAGGGDLADAVRRELGSLPVPGTLAVHGDLDALPEQQRRAVIRVVQEALSNVRHHSRATAVHVRLEQHDGELAVSIADDGRGFDLRRALAHAAERERFGLVGMRERVRLLGGDLRILTAPGAGTRVEFVLRPRDPLAVADARAVA